MSTPYLIGLLAWVCVCGWAGRFRALRYAWIGIGIGIGVLVALAGAVLPGVVLLLLIAVAVGAVSLAKRRPAPWGRRRRFRRFLHIPVDLAVDDSGIRCARRGGQPQSISWDDLEQIDVAFDGSVAPVPVIILIGQDQSVILSQRQTGFEFLTQVLDRLPDFDLDMAASALASTQWTGRRTCWCKASAAQLPAPQQLDDRPSA